MKLILTLLAPPTLTYLLTAYLVDVAQAPAVIDASWNVIDLLRIAVVHLSHAIQSNLLPFYAPEWVPYELARIALKWTLTAVFGTIAVCGLVGEVRERLAV